MILHRWAPRATEFLCVRGGQHYAFVPCQLLDHDHQQPGWMVADVPLESGDDYWFEVDGRKLPDPLGPRLPASVHGPSRWWDPKTYNWRASNWTGRALGPDSVIYELHVGTFTSNGTFDAAAECLDHLVDLGISHVELMPVNSFDGHHGWGYDQVALRAVHEPYGGPAGLCRFVDECHRRGLAVLLDIVHNHFGPSGNYWDAFGPFILNDHPTPWGGAVNLDGPDSDSVRTILIESLIMWAEAFRVDGFRMDAVHELRDTRAIPYLEQLGQVVASAATSSGRTCDIVVETDRNDPRTVQPVSGGGLGMTAQWDDDVHHALHAFLTGEASGYYRDFAVAEATATTLAQGFWHANTYSSFRGRTHGRPVDFRRVDPWRFICSLQTHDQVGNRAAGERLSHLTDLDKCAAGAAVLFTLPYTPMLFMGEEWAASTPWQFFTAFADPDLAQAVRDGRRSEFADYGWAATDIPDPQDAQTVERSTLDWSEATRPDHAAMLAWYRELIDLRRRHPDLMGAAAGPLADAADGIHVEVLDNQDTKAIAVRRGRWLIACNVGAIAVQVGATGLVSNHRNVASAIVRGPDRPVDPALFEEIVAQWPQTATRISGGVGAEPLTLPPGCSVIVRVRQTTRQGSNTS